MSKNGYFVISLDFELVWGLFDLIDFSKYENYFSSTRKTIPKILSAFEEHEIHATWAVVGMLFNENWTEWEKNMPTITPDYSSKQLNAYKFGQRMKSAKKDEAFFAPSLIRQIQKIKGQEIGTHTYSHYYCLEAGQDEKSFRADLQMAVSVAEKFDIELKSLVFPRNQIKEPYLEICNEFGIKNVRSNPDSWYWRNTQEDNLLSKIARTGDAYFPLGNKSYSFQKLKKGPTGVMEQPASRFLRPVESNGFLRKQKINRIKSEMLNAAKKGEIYHLWWHPHNFASDPKSNLQDLLDLLKFFKKCEEKYNFRSLNMAELGKLQK
ncbi:MAG TPA: polysaccharide deacetylase family protein [Salinimicrobium sp.]|nr:polysaccharide deacetylase family protein [Salinimicrobium sp.]